MSERKKLIKGGIEILVLGILVGLFFPIIGAMVGIVGVATAIVGTTK